MATCYDQAGKKIKCPRKSPRTQGVDEEGEPFQKFGTQQLEFVAPVVYGTPYQGVVQKDVGKTFKMLTTAPVQAVKGLLGLDTGTVFSQRIIAGKTGATPVGASYVPPPATPNGNGECDLGCWITGRGCDCGCKDVKPCTTCDSTVCKECNAWDLQCEDCKTKAGTCTPPEQKPPCDMGCWITGRGCECNGNGNGECGWWDVGCKVGKWWEQYGTVVMIIGGLIGLGILLWLLRPLFGIAKNITET